MALDEVIHTRMREADRVRIELAAEAAGVSVSQFVREAALDEARRTLRTARRQGRREENRAER